MFDRNANTLSLCPLRPTRTAGLTIAGLIVATLAFFVASPASASHRHTEWGHYVGWPDHVQLHGHGHHYQKHHHYRHSGWHSVFHVGLPLPHLELLFGHPHRSHRHGRDHSHVRDHGRKHRDRSDGRDRSRKHRDRNRHDRHDRHERRRG